MAGPLTLTPLSYKANEALARNRFVKLQGDEAVDQGDTAGERVLGVGDTDVSATEATSGKATGVHFIGAPYVEAGAAVTRGVRVSTDASGRAIAAVATHVPAGIALKAAGAAGDLIPVMLTPGLAAI